MTLAELKKRPQAKTEWLVSDLLPLSGLSVLGAFSKTGKSTVIRCLATVCAGGGGDWIGHKVGSGPVLHLALEERPSTIRTHYEALDADCSRIHLLDQRPPDPILRKDSLALAMQQIKPALVIIDPLSHWITIKDFNDYGQVTAALEPYIALSREHKSHLSLVHHSRKGGGSNGEELLGSTAFSAAADTVLSMSKSESNQRTIRAYGRDGVELEKTVLTMDPQSGWVSARGTVDQCADSNNDFKIMQCLRGSSEPMKADEIREAIGRRKDIVLKSLNRLDAAGRIKKETTEGRGRGVVYSIA